MDNIISAIIIAGGKSSRMGQNKALMHYNGQRLIDSAIQKMEVFTNQILISSNAAIDNVTYRLIADEITDIGPMSGLYTCLKASNTEINLVIPCDVPNLEPVLYTEMLDSVADFDAVIPRLPNGKLEPLAGCYKKSILPVVKACIEQNDYKMVNLLAKLNVKYINVENVAQFKNMNTPNDLL